MSYFRTRSRCFRLLIRSCFAFTFLAQLLQYFARDDLERKRAPQTVQRLSSARGGNSASSSLSRGSTAAWKYLQFTDRECAWMQGTYSP